MKFIRNSKKMLSIILVLSLILVVTACSRQDTKTSPSTSESSSSEPAPVESGPSDTEPSESSPSDPAPSESSSSEPDASELSDITKIDNSSAKITVMTQEYIGDNIAEILMISYDNEKNPELDSFNNAINFGVQEIYNNFIENSKDDSWIDIRSYPFTSNDYLQIVTTRCIYPTYGTDGDLCSYNFDLKENKFMSIDDALSDLQLSRDNVADTVRGLLENKNNDGTTAKAVDVVGFLITQGQSGPQTQLLLQVDLKTTDGDTWNSFIGYTPELGEIVYLNKDCLFDPSDVDQMDQPFSYQTDILSSTLISELFFDTSDLEYLPERNAYLFDGMILFSVETLSPVSYSQDDVLEQIKSLEPSKIELINITESDEHTELLYSPSWLVIYLEGGNEDTLHCKDIYVQTDTADFRLHTSVAADFALDYHDEIGRRLASVYWIE